MAQHTGSESFCWIIISIQNYHLPESLVSRTKQVQFSCQISCEVCTMQVCRKKNRKYAHFKSTRNLTNLKKKFILSKEKSVVTNIYMYIDAAHHRNFVRCWNSVEKLQIENWSRDYRFFLFKFVRFFIEDVCGWKKSSCKNFPKKRNLIWLKYPKTVRWPIFNINAQNYEWRRVDPENI